MTPLLRRPKLNRSFVRYRDRGDPHALAWVFDQTAPALRRIAQHVARGRMEADDLVQATFLTAIQRAASYDPDRPLVPWLAGILVRLAQNAARRSDVTRETALPESVPLDSMTEKDVLDAVLLREERDAVRRAVEALPAKYQEVVRRHLEAGESGGEIASALGRTPATVRSQLFRGLALLRRAMPASFTPGAILAAGMAGAASGTARGSDVALAAMRARVLSVGAEAATRTTAASVAVLSYGKLGGLIMSMRTVLVVGVLVLASVTALILNGWTSAPPGSAHSGPHSDIPQLDTPAIAAVAPEPAAAAAPTSRDAAPVTAEPAEPKRFEWRPRAGEADVRGVVVDDATGQRVEGARVWVYMGGFRGAEPPSFAVLTDDAGHFEIQDLDPGGFRTLHVWSHAHALASVELDVPPERVANEQGVDAGIIRLVRGTTLTGRVLDAKDRGIEGAEIFLLTNRYASSFLPGYSRPVGISGVGGAFTLDRIPPSDWTESRFYAISDRGSGATDLTIAVDRPRMEDVVIRLGPTATLDVVVVDASGSPVEGATVEAAPIFPPYTYTDMSTSSYRERSSWTDEVRRIRVNDESGPGRHFCATTNATGLASIPQLSIVSSPAPFCIRATRSGYVTAFEDLVEIAPGAATRIQLTLLREVKRSLRGVVVDAAGRPASGVEVRRYEWFQGRFSTMTSAVETDGGGRFTMDGLVPGDAFHVLTAKEGASWIPTRIEVPVDHDPDPIELRLTPAAPIRGQIVDQFDVPVEGVYVQANQGDWWMYTRTPTTGQDGRFDVPDATSGTWRLRIVMPDPADQWLQSQIEPDVEAGGNERRFTVHREEAGKTRLVVRVVEAGTGLPLTAKRAYLSRTNLAPETAWFAWQPEIERYEGRLVAERLKVGSWSLYVECDGYPPHRMGFEVGQGDSQVDLHAVIGDYGKIQGTVRLDGGARPPHAVILWGDGRAVNQSGQTFEGYTPGYHPLDESLSFHFDTVPPGAARLQLTGYDEVVVTVKPGESTTCELVARPLQ